MVLALECWCCCYSSICHNTRWSGNKERWVKLFIWVMAGAFFGEIRRLSKKGARWRWTKSTWLDVVEFRPNGLTKKLNVCPHFSDVFFCSFVTGNWASLEVRNSLNKKKLNLQFKPSTMNSIKWFEFPQNSISHRSEINPSSTLQIEQIH